jgi:hypothetical protein
MHISTILLNQLKRWAEEVGKQSVANWQTIISADSMSFRRISLITTNSIEVGYCPVIPFYLLSSNSAVNIVNIYILIIPYFKSRNTASLLG